MISETFVETDHKAEIAELKRTQVVLNKRIKDLKAEYQKEVQEMKESVVEMSKEIKASETRFQNIGKRLGRFGWKLL